LYEHFTFAWRLHIPAAKMAIGLGVKDHVGLNKLATCTKKQYELLTSTNM